MILYYVNYMPIKSLLSKTPICLCFRNTEKQSNLMNLRNRISEPKKKRII